jgi:glutathionyl-hydroquinone reductase
VTLRIYSDDRQLSTYLGSIETALEGENLLVGDRVTLADIGFTAEIIQPSQTRRGELGVVVGESADQ